MLRVLIFILIPIGFWSCVKTKGENTEIVVSVKERINGVHVFSRNEVPESEFGIIQSKNINTIVLVPYYYQKGLDTDTMMMSARRGYEWTERDEGIIDCIQKAHSNGLEVIIKPHLWPFGIEGDAWRESVYPKGDNWDSWSKDYANATMHYAKMAQKYDCKMLCIGTELKDLALKKPQFWRELISDIRTIYEGELVYAANWYEEYEKITFWDQLDYIGIQGYFPLSENKNPGKQELIQAWKQYKNEIKKVSKKFGKPVLFTELGYKCTQSAADKPWEWDETWGGKSPKFEVSEEIQAICYEAYFECFAETQWMAGTLIWNWRMPYHKFGGSEDQNFTPQRKIAENVIRKYYLNIN